MSNFNIEGGYVSEAKGALATGAASLPFPASYCRWMNGNSSLAESADARFFGGWEIGVDGANGLSESMNAYEFETLPFGWKEITNHNKSGEAYQSVISRVGIFVTIGKRLRWKVNPDTGSKSSIANWLTLLCTFDPQQKTYAPMFPVILTAKGWSSKYVEDAIAAFATQTATIRREVASNSPAFLFYHPLGTHGKEPDVTMVGKSPNQSPITTCDVILPGTIDQAYIERAFIGQEVADTCAGYLHEAREWLDAWDDLDETDETPGEPTENDYSKQASMQPLTEDEPVPF